MKRLDRYVVKELSVPLFIGTFVFALLFVANDMMFIYKTYNVSAIPVAAIVQLLTFQFPQWLAITLPIGTSLGASLAVSRLARESEITAMRAAGISVFRVFRPLFFCGAIMAVVNFAVIEKLVPPAMKAYRKLSNEVGFLAVVPEFRSNVMLSINRYSANFGSISREREGVVRLRDILLIERPRPGEVMIYRSEEGEYRDGVWKVYRPYVIDLKGTVLQSADSKDVMVINEPIEVGDLFMPPKAEEQTIGSLSRSIKEAQEHGMSSRSLEISYHRKFADPVACVVFAFTGAVLAMRFSRAGPFMGVMVSLGLVWLYFNAYVVAGDILGKNGWINPVLSAWSPNIVFGCFGLLFVRRLE